MYSCRIAQTRHCEYVSVARRARIGYPERTVYPGRRWNEFFRRVPTPEERSFIYAGHPLESICQPLRGGCASLHAVNAQTLSGNLVLYWFGGVYVLHGGGFSALARGPPRSGTCAKPGNIKTNGKRLYGVARARRTFLFIFICLFRLRFSFSFFFFFSVSFSPSRIGKTTASFLFFFFFNRPLPA